MIGSASILLTVIVPCQQQDLDNLRIYLVLNMTRYAAILDYIYSNTDAFRKQQLKDLGA